MIKPFWVEFHKALKNIINTDLPLEFTVLFLGNVDLLTRCADKYMYGILISACKKAITRRWLLPEPPTIQEWTDIVNSIYVMERITFSLRLQKELFTQFWTKWIKYIKPLQPDFVEI